MKNKTKKIIPRLPMEIVLALHTKGGPQSSKKGGRGYDRQRDKNEIRESLKKDDSHFFPNSYFQKCGFR